ncbi:MAG: hypothetical protein PHF25_09485 [Candidatus Margulisbacteria bacterium]|nr:hypothetical protein [Candidatus Margulisiibacteriota bacterium]
MINGYTKSEIRMLYKDAKNKDRQIEILCQLTGLRTFEVEKILEEGGYLNTMTDLMKDRIVDLYNQGLSDSAIGRELKVAQSQVSTFLRAKGLPPNSRKKSNKKVEVKEVPEHTKEPIKEETKKSIDKLVDEVIDYYDGRIEKTIEPIKVGPKEIIEKLKEETHQNIEEIKEVLPLQEPEPEDLPIDYDVVDTLTPQQYYELAKITLQLLKIIWEG